MKVVFLDIDGVLVFWGSKECCDGRLGVMDRAATERLNRIVRETGAKVVLSSTWRFCLGKDTPREPNRCLRAAGFVGELFDVTPFEVDCVQNGVILLTRPSRSEEIQAWLAAHPEVSAYVALDDETLTIKNHIQTSWMDGLRDEHVERAIAILGRV